HVRGRPDARGLRPSILRGRKRSGPAPPALGHPGSRHAAVRRRTVPERIRRPESTRRSRGRSALAAPRARARSVLAGSIRVPQRGEPPRLLGLRPARPQELALTLHTEGRRSRGAPAAPTDFGFGRRGSAAREPRVFRSGARNASRRPEVEASAWERPSPLEPPLEPPPETPSGDELHLAGGREDL